jgi:tetratricopeptide (TPR) repeat protein
VATIVPAGSARSALPGVRLVHHSGAFGSLYSARFARVGDAAPTLLEKSGQHRLPTRMKASCSTVVLGERGDGVDEGLDSPEAFGMALRRARNAKGVSLSDLGQMVHYSKGHLSKLENGVVPAHLDLAKACDAALGSGGQLTAVFLEGLARRAPQPAAAMTASPFDIPPPTAHFVGRASETTRVVEAIFHPDAPSRAPTLMIHGMPGIGKTALALHVAHTLRSQYPGGCLFVNFGSAPGGQQPAANVHALLLRRLGVASETVPAEPGEARALYLSTLNRRPVLVVADGVTSSGQVAELVPASAACAVIATSRRRLDALDDCCAIGLGPLAAEDGAVLFRAVIGEAYGGSEADLARICVACGGVPLAIRVAAARFRGSRYTAAEFADRLESPDTIWQELDDGERSIQRTLRADFQALSESGQRTLAMLALYPGTPVGRHAMAWLRGSSPQEAARDVAGLARYDLVSVDGKGKASASALVRAFASGVLRELDAGSRADGLHRLVAGYTRSAFAAESAITPLRFLPPASGPAGAASPMEFDGASQAMDWCGDEAAVVPRLCSLAFELGMDADCWRLAYAFRGYFFAVKALRPWITSHRVALRAADRSGDRWAQAVTRNNLGMALTEQGKVEEAQAEYGQALQILHALDDERGVATTLGHQAWASYLAGQYEPAITLAQQAIALNRHNDDERAVAIMDRTAALVYSALGQHRSALKHLAECKVILSELDLPLDVAMMLNCLGEVHFAMGHRERANAFHTRAAEQSMACGGLGEQVRAVRGLAVCARAAGAEVRADGLDQWATARAHAPR